MPSQNRVVSINSPSTAEDTSNIVLPEHCTFLTQAAKTLKLYQISGVPFPQGNKGGML